MTQYAAKAAEFAAAATAELAAGRLTAAASLAIHAAISSVDAVCGARLGIRSAGEGHAQVLDLLQRAGSDGAALEAELRRILPLKNRSQYEPEEVSYGTAGKAVDRAQRCATLAARVVANTS